MRNTNMVETYYATKRDIRQAGHPSGHSVEGRQGDSATQGQEVYARDRQQGGGDGRGEEGERIHESLGPARRKDTPRQRFIKRCFPWSIGYLSERDRERVEGLLGKMSMDQEKEVARLMEIIAYRDWRDGVDAQAKEYAATELDQLLNLIEQASA